MGVKNIYQHICEIIIGLLRLFVDEAREELDKRIADYGDAVKDHWFCEGEVISAHINEEWVKKSIKT